MKTVCFIVHWFKTGMFQWMRKSMAISGVATELPGTDH